MDWSQVDAKWQRFWKENETFKARAVLGPKFFLTVAYPYVSGPMHVGHARTYTIPDIIARYKRMRGFNVLFPMAFHFTGTPLLGASKRVQNRDPEFLRMLTELFGVNENEIPKFEDPHYFGNYFARESDMSYKKSMRILGYSIDWDREFTTIDEAYKKFIGWQYRKLMDMNLVTKGAHPVKWCPGCQNPVTDHDLLEGEGAKIVEYSLVKYRYNDYILPAATLRPETIFGVTNLWLNPGVNYVSVDVNGERWIVSENAVEKLRNRGFDVGEVTEFEETLIGKMVKVPMIDKKVPILPAKFVDPNSASGVVYSVPSHAPYDYVALEELRQNPEDLEPYEINPDDIRKMGPISLIELPEYGESPAIDVVKREGISSQKDSKLEKATEEVYRREFSKGVIRNWVPDYAGMRVSRAKDEVHRALLESDEGSSMYEFSEKPVICRCGTQCMVRVVEDQWFLDYSNVDWKEKTRLCLGKMDLIPAETREQFEYTINWLEEWPCTRKVGMGTQAPWDPAWIIESLSDSTIYMVYYTVSHILRDIGAEKLTDDVFDYIFLGMGDMGELSSSSGIEREKLEQMRKEVEYWYPQDYRLSANELISNHLTFHIFHHVALFPNWMWSGGIVTFGMALLEGSKMSTSKGNILPINKATKKYGADAVRLYLASGVDPWQDFNWRAEEAEAMVKHLNRFYELGKRIVKFSAAKPSVLDQPARWMLSKLQHRARDVTEALEAFEIREASQHAFFLMMQDVRRYMKRAKVGKSRNWVLHQVLDKWVRILSPLIPHVCEEIWHQMGKEGSISTAEWPEVDGELMDGAAEITEEYLKELERDIRKVLQATNIEKPKRICLYVARGWKRRAYKMALEQIREKELDMGDLIKKSREEFVDVSPDEIADFFKRVIEELGRISDDKLEALSEMEFDELEALREALEFLMEKFDVDKVEIFKANDPDRFDPRGRAERSISFRPAIYVE